MRQPGRKVFFLLVVLGLLAAIWGSEACAQRAGLVLMHGKGVNLENLGDLSAALEGQGFLVVTPMMPWSRDRYLNATYEAALDEIAGAIQKLKQRGATRIVVAGHSMGANAALSYAANRGGVDGVIMLAPGHFPSVLVATLGEDSLSKAREMVKAGRGPERADFQDSGFTLNTTAQIYLSYFDPQGSAAMIPNAARLNAKIPVLMVVADNDPRAKTARKIFARLPANPSSQILTVTADHLEVPSASKGEVVRWLKNLPN